MSEYHNIGTKVFYAPQPPAPIVEPATDKTPAVLGEEPERPYGIVRGLQDHEPPVSYLVAKDSKFGGGVEWFSTDAIEAVGEEAAAPAAAEGDDKAAA
jgi:hypothetical protein